MEVFPGSVDERLYRWEDVPAVIAGHNEIAVQGITVLRIEPVTSDRLLSRISSASKRRIFTGPLPLYWSPNADATKAYPFWSKLLQPSLNAADAPHSDSGDEMVSLRSSGLAERAAKS